MLKSLGGCFLAICFACTGFAQDGVDDSVSVEAVPKEEGSTIQTQSENNFDKVDSDVLPAQIRRLSDTSVNRVRRDEDYWYANMIPEKDTQQRQKTESGNKSHAGRTSKDEAERKNIFETDWFNSLFWIIIVGSFVAALVWYLRSSDIRLFRKPSVAIADSDDEAVIEDIFDLDYDKEIAAAIEAQNFRLATRLMYLRTLKELSDRELIQYKNERTNSDYLFQLSGTEYYRDFFRLTRDFEYTWYGAFALSPDSFAIVQKDFSSFKQRLA